jgi:ElaB/YqjD/DUF883 family membrane-anchored ribosome-binding protein
MDTATAKGALGQTDRALREDIDAVKEDLGKLRDDMKSMTRDLADAARSGVREARGYVTDAASVAANRGKNAVKTVEHQIEDNPMAAVGIAFGVGLLLGALFIGARR